VIFVADGGMVVASFSSFAAKRNYQLSYESRTKLFMFHRKTHFLAVRVVNCVAGVAGMRKSTARAVRAEARVPKLVADWFGTIAHCGRCNRRRMLQSTLKMVRCLGNVRAINQREKLTAPNAQLVVDFQQGIFF
jgi:4'-phosphopantetheinyl transferase EntD